MRYIQLYAVCPKIGFTVYLPRIYFSTYIYLNICMFTIPKIHTFLFIGQHTDSH